MATIDLPRTEVSELDAAPSKAPQRKRKLGGFSGAKAFNLVGAGVAGVAVAFLLDLLTALSGPVALTLVAYVAFLVVYAVLVSLDDETPVVRDAVMTVLMATCAVIAFGALGTVVVFTLARGWAALVHYNFYSQDMSKAGPLAPLTVGGMGHALVGTVWMVGIAVVLTVPLGLLGAVYLDVTRGRPSRFFRTVVEAMTALPSILAGLFIYAAWILEFGFGRSGLAAALALSVMMLPYIIRASDLALRLVPANLREASAALGAPTWRGEWQVVIPTARSGLATAVILGVARSIGEASPVLLTAGFTSYMNANPLHGAMVSLPLETLKLVQTGVPSYTSRAFGCASFLLLVVIVLFLVARKIGGWGPGHLSPRARRRVMASSAKDLERFNRKLGAPAPADVAGTASSTRTTVTRRNPGPSAEGLA
jgi:phosphate transport system permease protein